MFLATLHCTECGRAQGRGAGGAAGTRELRPRETVWIPLLVGCTKPEQTQSLSGLVASVLLF